jgi:hypothetical protein
MTERSAAVLPANFSTKRKRFLARSNCIVIRLLFGGATCANVLTCPARLVEDKE